MMQVGPRESAAGVAAAVRIHGGVRLAVPGILDIEAAPGREQSSVTGLAGGQHAIEEINTLLDAEQQVFGRADAHEIAGPVPGQLMDEFREGRVHQCLGFAHAEPAHGETLERRRGIHLQDLMQVVPPQIQVRTALIDGKEALMLPQREIPAAAQPPRGARHALFQRSAIHATRRTFIQSHDDIGTQIRLNLHGAFGAQEMTGSIYMALKSDAFFTDLSHGGERKNLKAATVREDGSIPSHECVESAEPRHQFVAGPQTQVIGVAENHLRPDFPELRGRDALHRSLRSHGHEGRGENLAVGSLEPSRPVLHPFGRR